MPIVGGRDEWWGAIELQFEGILGHGSWTHSAWEQWAHTSVCVLLCLEYELCQEVFISLARFIWASQWIVLKRSTECGRLIAVVLCGFVAFLIGPFT